MNRETSPEPVRPPVALGCFFAVAVVVVFVGVVAFFLVFLDSGADTGELRLEQAEAYAPGEVAFIPTENVFLARLADGSFRALSDLDAANRANQGSRCRVALVPLADAAPGVPENAVRAQMSVEAAGSDSVLREICLGSVYDVAGAKLFGEGRNLDLHPVDIDGDGRVTIDTSERSCSVRTATATFSPVDCRRSE